MTDLATAMDRTLARYRPLGSPDAPVILSGDPPPPEPYRCLRCRDMGLLVDDTDPENLLVVPCPCRDGDRALRRLARYRSQESLGEHATASLETMVPTALQGRAHAAAARFAADPRGTFVLLGPVGTGKSTLAAAIGAAYTTRGTALFARVPSLLRELRSAFDGQGETFAARMDALVRVGLLVLDDLGAEASSAWSAETVYALVEERRSAGRPTVIAANITLSALGDRIASRLVAKETGQIVVVRGRDVRAHGLVSCGSWSLSLGGTPHTPYHGGSPDRPLICTSCDCFPHLDGCPSDARTFHASAPPGLCPVCRQPGGRHSDECYQETI